MRNKLWALALLAVSSVAAFGQVPIIGSTINATTGFEVAGTAPNAHYLCGNGTNYVDSASTCTSITQFYQTIDLNGSAQNQRFALNFSSFFTATDTASPSRTNVDAAQVGANAVCTNPTSVTVDVYGRTTACGSGTAPRVVQTFSVSGCTTAASTDNACQGTITLPVAMADTNYTPVMTLNATAFNPTSGGGPFLAIELTGALTTTSFPYNITCTFGCGVSTVNTIYVIAYHN